jgi:hypothetical protein
VVPLLRLALIFSDDPKQADRGADGEKVSRTLRLDRIAAWDTCLNPLLNT